MSKYKFQAKVWVSKNKDFVISEGRVRLLKLIEQHGSLKKAAEDMKMSYRHAWGIIKKINESMGEDVVRSERGGVHGGKTFLTSKGRELLEEYEARKGQADIIMKFGPRPSITVDGIITKKDKILLVRRRNNPYKGKFALPGGFVEFKEPVENAVVREVREETGLETKISRMTGVYSSPERDPRGHTISVIFELKITGGKLKAGSDAKELGWFDINKLPELGFDHEEIIKDFLVIHKK